MKSSIHTNKFKTIHLILILIFLSITHNIAQTNFQVKMFHVNSIYYTLDFEEGLLCVTYTPGDAGKYLSVGVQLDEIGGLFDIIIDNFYLPPIENNEQSRTICKRFNLSSLKDDGTIGHSYTCYIHLFDEVSLYPYDPSTHVATVYVYDVFELENNAIGVESTEDHSVIQIIPVSPPNHTLADPASSLIHRTNTPNFDLNDSQHGDTDNYAGDLNACVPTAVSNSMLWLSDQYNDIAISGKFTQREILENLSGKMNRERNEGTYFSDLVRGLLDFIEEQELPLEVKFQSFFKSGNIASTSGNSIARNFNNPNNKRPTWEFLKKQMRDGENVVMNYTWYNNSDSTWYSHSVVVSGINEFESGVKKIEIRHDLNQSDSGGTVTEVHNITVDSSGWMRFGNNGRNFIKEVVAESPIIQEGRETAAWLNEIFADINIPNNKSIKLQSVDKHFIEIALHQKVKDLENYKIEFYNSDNGEIYNTTHLDQFSVGSINDSLILYIYDFTADTFRIPTGGISLSYTGTIIPNQFFSYGGQFVATEGDAFGLTSNDIGSLSNQSSISLAGIGATYPSFIWQSDSSPSPGSPNSNQFLTRQIPETPNLLIPVNNSVDQPLELDFLWYSSELASEYSIQIATDEQFANIFYMFDGISDTTINITGLEEKTKYYWRVLSTNGNGSSNYSDIWNFTTKAATGIESDNNLPENFYLSQNYPNPFNPSTAVSFGVPLKSYIQLNIYNALGEIIYNLYSGTKSAGRYKINFDASDFQSGIYFLRMNAVSIEGKKQFVKVRKLVFLK